MLRSTVHSRRRLLKMREDLLQKGNLARSAGNSSRVTCTPGKTERIANDLLSGVTLAVTSVPQVFSRPG